MDDNLTVIRGEHDQLAGKIQGRYGYTKRRAEDGPKAWERDTRW